MEFFGKANVAKETTEEKEAREKLELVLTELGIHKRTDSTYNQDEYINNKLKSEGMQIEDNIVTVEGWQFEIDRSVPKIVKRVGEIEESLADLNIYNKEDMEHFRDEVNRGNTFEGKTIQVKADIYLDSKYSWTPIGTVDNPFKGEFDGKNHTINNLYINANEGIQGLFKMNEGSIKNIIVNGEVIANGGRIAGVCAVNKGTLENVINYANVTNQSTTEDITGGIVGVLRGSMKDCNNYGEVKANYSNVGGIVGHANLENFTIDSCHNYGKIETAANQIGGIVGSVWEKGIIKNCINEGNVSATSQSSGGIVGYIYNSSNASIIQRCVNKGKIEAGTWAPGGIIGAVNTSANVIECKNEGEIFAGRGDAGGIVGSNKGEDDKFYISTIEKCTNSGYVHAEGNGGAPGCGGILGSIGFGDNCTIDNCYNIGKVASTSYTIDTSHGVGGILGAVYYNGISTSEQSKATIFNCYNKGDIENSYSSSNAGHILGTDGNNNRRIENCYYLDTAKGSNTLGGIGLAKDTLKGYAETLGEAFTTPIGNKNEGFPILNWEK